MRVRLFPAGQRLALLLSIGLGTGLFFLAGSVLEFFFLDAQCVFLSSLAEADTDRYDYGEVAATLEKVKPAAQRIIEDLWGPLGR